MTGLRMVAAATFLTLGLTAGASRACSPEEAALIQTFYQQYLHRSADACGLRAWAKQLRCDGVEAVQAGILSSDEYYCAHGRCPDGFVRGLYEDVLGRQACAREVHEWVCRLQRCGCRGRLAADFVVAARAELTAGRFAPRHSPSSWPLAERSGGAGVRVRVAATRRW
jgi:hypothetical protein